jgi:hypothetical protein
MLVREQRRYFAQLELKNRFLSEYTKLMGRYNIDCKLCVIYQLKKYRLMRFYINPEYIQEYLSKRSQYDNYIMNIAIVGDYFMRNVAKSPNESINFEYLYLYVFDAPFYQERFKGTLRYSDRYETKNKYLLAIPIAINYCNKLGNKCYDQLLEEIDIGILDQLYTLDYLSNTYYLK